MLPLDVRRAVIRRVPWIRFHAEPDTCTAFLSRTPLKAIFSMYGRPPVGLANYRCKMPAHWAFRALKRKPFRSGVNGDYCWFHLHHSGLFGDEYETDRFRRWRQRHYPELASPGEESDG